MQFCTPNVQKLPQKTKRVLNSQRVVKHFHVYLQTPSYATLDGKGFHVWRVPMKSTIIFGTHFKKFTGEFGQLFKRSFLLLCVIFRRDCAFVSHVDFWGHIELKTRLLKTIIRLAKQIVFVYIACFIFFKRVSLGSSKSDIRQDSTITSNCKKMILSFQAHLSLSLNWPTLFSNMLIINTSILTSKLRY